MHLRSTCLRIGAPLALTTLVACQAQPTQQTPMTTPTPPAAATATPSAAVLPLASINARQILVDQVGYVPGHTKTAVIVDADAASFDVVDTSTSRAVVSGSLNAPMRDPDTGQALRIADFSTLREPGTYTVQVPGVGRSPEFRIAEDAYRQLNSDSLKQYEQLAILAPAAWQTATAQDRKTGASVDITGGWPDAGDYGKYMPSAASAMGTLLLLHDVFPEKTSPDQLQVLRRELDWMLKMQRPDGAVYHKVTPLHFGGFDKGSDNIGGQLFVFDASTPDAAVFAATMAEAARIYRPFDAAYGDRLLKAAEKSWAYLRENSKPVLPAETEGTGGYVYSRDGSQRLWAAAELFKTTGDVDYGTYIATYLDQHAPSIAPLGWSDPQTYAVLSLLTNSYVDVQTKSRLQQLLTRWADGMATTIASPADPWRISVSTFHWASNKTALDNAVVLLVANSLTPNPRYVDAALDQLHFVLGRNALAKSFVTNYGANPVANPHNRTMFSLGRLVPGVLVGGPNGDAQDGLTPAGQGQRSYIDQLQAYASNENSVEYNAPLVFVTSVLS
jgi:endoglucanase